MSITQNAATILTDHVTLEVEGIDRMYPNGSVPRLPWEQGIESFSQRRLGQPVASSAPMAPRTCGLAASAIWCVTSLPVSRA